MVRTMLFMCLIGFKIFLFSCSEAKPKKAFLGKWVGDPYSYFKKEGYKLEHIQSVIWPCIVNTTDGSSLMSDIYSCSGKLENFVRNSLSGVCKNLGYPHYLIANLRVSQSNTIGVSGTWTSKSTIYGHLMIIYADVFCARELGIKRYLPWL